MTRPQKHRRPTIAIPAPGKWYTPEMKRWLCGYEPMAFSDRTVGLTPYKKGVLSRQVREAAQAAGIGWGAGTIEGLGKNTQSHNNSPIQRIRVHPENIGSFPVRKAA